MTAMILSPSKPTARHCERDSTVPEVDIPLVLLHGWGNDSSCWRGLVQELHRDFNILALDLPGFGGSDPVESVEDALSTLDTALPEACHLLGWSLGGMLAVCFAAHHPHRVKRVMTLASNACFTVRPDWPDAMARNTFVSFANQFEAEPAAALRQFCGLQAKGDTRERELLRLLRAASPEPRPAWWRSLQWLAELDNREYLARLAMPSLHLFGDRDGLVPARAATGVAKLVMPLGRCEILPGQAHAPHVSDPATVASQCRQFFRSSTPNPYGLRKEQIASSFGKAAATYDRVAELQRQVGERLLGLIPSGAGPQAVVDVGCGTGYFTDKLAERYPDARCMGIDLSPGMLEFAAAKYDKGMQWLCADAEALPLDDASQHLLFSNFAFQWCTDLPALFAEQYRVLKDGGLLVFSTVGPASLAELRQAWSRVDRYVHVNRFDELEVVTNALVEAGFSIHLQREETRVRHYAKLQEFTRELKALGAHNINAGRKAGLTSVGQLQKLMAAYEEFRCEKGLPATWQIFHLVAVK
jgi:malonyl-CoA O-methyltransferase